MAKDHAFFDDLSKLASSATGAMLDMKREVETLVTAQMEKMLSRMHLVTREEHELVKAMAQKAREENESLSKRLEALEKGSKPKSTKKA